MKRVQIESVVRLSVSYCVDDKDPVTNEPIYETEDDALEDASNRLYDALYEGLCMRANEAIEFAVENTEIEIKEENE